METSGVTKREAVYIAEEIVRKSAGFAFDIGTVLIIFCFFLFFISFCFCVVLLLVTKRPFFKNQIQKGVRIPTNACRYMDQKGSTALLGSLHGPKVPCRCRLHT